MSMTTASIVARLPRETEPTIWPCWISFATPCTGIFIPVYLDGVIPAEFASPGEPGIGFGSGSRSVWCAMRDLQEKATSDFARTLPMIQKEWLDFARELESERLRVERSANESHAAGRFEEGGQRLTAFMATTADRVLETSERLIDAI